jgi:magnesium chelatase family protein
MRIYCFASTGFEGYLVQVEVDIRRGIPGLEIVGLPDSAVRESRDRVRIAIRNSGFAFPRDRILVNLAPADVRKEGSSFDLPIAIAILLQSQEILPGSVGQALVMGELQLSGRIRPVHGVLSAVAAGLENGITRFLVPPENLAEGRALRTGNVSGPSDLATAADQISTDRPPTPETTGNVLAGPSIGSGMDFADVRGHVELKRALAIAAAGRHHTLLFGPPGSGKTLAAARIPSILPDLTWEESISVTRVHSLAGLLGPDCGLIQRPPVRTPHHSASAEGLVGGGRIVRPGEISLANLGLLILDEVSEFRRDLLQSLREPMESGRIELARAGMAYWYPADFQLVMTTNPCSCGNLGRDDAGCICTRYEVEKHWKKLGGALLDRVDLRIPVRPVAAGQLLGEPGTSSADLIEGVLRARSAQAIRSNGPVPTSNGKLGPAGIARDCSLDRATSSAFTQAVRSVSLSARACHSILRVARTIADFDGVRDIDLPHLYEAIQLRRYGDSDYFWT